MPLSRWVRGLRIGLNERGALHTRAQKPPSRHPSRSSHTRPVRDECCLALSQAISRIEPLIQSGALNELASQASRAGLQRTDPDRNAARPGHRFGVGSHHLLLAGQLGPCRHVELEFSSHRRRIHARELHCRRRVRDPERSQHGDDRGVGGVGLWQQDPDRERWHPDCEQHRRDDDVPGGQRWNVRSQRDKWYEQRNDCRHSGIHHAHIRRVEHH